MIKAISTVVAACSVVMVAGCTLTIESKPNTTTQPTANTNSPMAAPTPVTVPPTKAETFSQLMNERASQLGFTIPLPENAVTTSIKYAKSNCKALDTGVGISSVVDVFVSGNTSSNESVMKLYAYGFVTGIKVYCPKYFDALNQELAAR